MKIEIKARYSKKDGNLIQQQHAEFSISGLQGKVKDQAIKFIEALVDE